MSLRAQVRDAVMKHVTVNNPNHSHNPRHKRVLEVDRATDTRSVVAYEQSLRDRDREVGAFFDQQGNFLSELKASADPLQLDASFSQVPPGSVFTHNHPYLADRAELTDDQTFSDSDFMQAAKMKLGELRVVTNRGVHIATPGPKGWGDRQAIWADYGRFFGPALAEAKATGVGFFRGRRAILERMLAEKYGWRISFIPFEDQ